MSTTTGTAALGTSVCHFDSDGSYFRHRRHDGCDDVGSGDGAVIHTCWRGWV